MKPHRTILLVSLLITIILTTISLPLGQTPSTPVNEDYDVIKTDTNLVTLNVSVTRKNRPITDLAAADFQITDTGAVVKPEFFEPQGPASIVFVIDISASMSGRKWTNLNEGLKTFLKKEKDRDYTLVIFNEKPRLLTQSVPADQFWNLFRQVKPSGETALYDALSLGLDQINCLKHRRKAIILLSDGENNQSKTDLVTIQEEVLSKHTTIYAVGILIDSSQPDRYRGKELLEELAKTTGGLTYFPHPDQIDRVLTDISREISAQYSFGYYASHPTTGWRDVNVKLLRSVDGMNVRYPARYLVK